MAVVEPSSPQISTVIFTNDRQRPPAQMNPVIIRAVVALMAW